MSLDFPKPEKKLFETKLTDVESTDVEGVGTVRKDIEGNVYRWVKNGEASAALAAGDSVCYDMSNAGASLRTIVLKPVSADLMLYAGIAMAAISAGSYGWVLINGYYATAKVDAPVTTAIALGNALIPANGITHLVRSTAAGTAPVYKAHALALEAVDTVATGSTTTAKVLVCAGI